MAECYWIVVGAKPSHVIDETFCSILIDNTNCCYLDCLTFGVSTTRCKPAKQKGFSGGVSVASLMIKSAKGVEKRRKGVNVVGFAYLSLWGGGGGGGVSVLYLNFSLILGTIIS